MSNSELSFMEDSHAVEEDRSSVSAPSSFATFLSPSFITTGPDFTTDSILESKAISMASNDCSSAISSPAEASPAKPAEMSTSIFKDTFDHNPDTSHMASASDSLKSSEMSIINVSDLLPWSAALSSVTFGGPEQKNDFPPVLTFKGVSVTLENNNIWKEFNECGTEMILTKQGRRMFPYCRYRLSGLDPEQLYSLVLSIVPSGLFKYRWSASKWEVSGETEHQNQGLIRAFSHHYSPCRGSEWMSCLVSFYKLKLTNNFQDKDGHMILHSMHRYIPRLHIIPLPNGDPPTADTPVVLGPESMTFTFPQTEFMAVTTYQNFRITQLKINHNPFAKGFREDGHNSRLHRISAPVRKMDVQPEDCNPAEPGEHQEEMMDLSTASDDAPPPPSNTHETRHVLEPIMSNLSGSGASYVPCIRGKHALGEIVLVNKHPDHEPSETVGVTSTSNVQQALSVTPLATSSTPGSSVSTPVSTRPYVRKKRKKVKRRWGLDYRPRIWKAASATTPTVVPSPSMTVTMQPELDDIEGMLFASFTTKEALEIHARDSPASVLSTESTIPSTKPKELEEIMVVNPEMEEKMARLESLLLNDLSVFKHRQVIHPVLQEVGLKLSSLDPAVPVDLNYVGVHLPLPFPVLTEQSSTAPTPPDEGLPFISRTGKTSDMTKIKGWRNKFSKIQETLASNSEVPPKNLSAFCSNMLDEYLESEAQQISDRAAAFSTNPESPVTYQLPDKSSSYVKTLDSVLRHQNTAAQVPEALNRPCPLSRKPPPYTSLRSQVSPLTTPEPQHPAEPQSTSSSSQPDSSSGYGYVSQRILTNEAAVSKTPPPSTAVVPPPEMLGQNQELAQKDSSFSKDQLSEEMGTLNQALGRTHLTPERLTMALSVLTPQTPPHQVSNLPSVPHTDEEPKCGREFCRLGCLCSSLECQEEEPAHCGRPECMFDCTCSDTMITMEQSAQSRPGFNAKLWNCDALKSEPDELYVPKSSESLVPAKVQKRSEPHPVPVIREEDKDPVYKYLESKLTCARVRAFNSEPPPVVTLNTETHAPVFKPKITKKPLNFTQTLSKKNYKALLMINQKAEENPSQKNASSEKESKKQIHIHSLCQWKKDRKKVLEGLYERMNQNRLHQRFFIGPYFIRPVAKVVLQKPSGSVVTYRIQIKKPTHVSDYEEESDEYDDYDSDGNVSTEKEDELVEDPEMWYGVTPFLKGVLQAGSLTAKKRSIGYKATGLIEVNGKHYNYARLALGNMGSLHPANRLAAFVTGRLPPPKAPPQTIPHLQGSVIKPVAAGSVHNTSAYKLVVPAGIEKTQAAHLKPAVELLQSLSKGSVALHQPSPNSPTIYPLQLLIPIQSLPQPQNNSTPLPSSLTVSPSLKNPAFLAQSGTYSFRICPPSNQAVGGQNPPGIVLPGGFTLIELPKPGPDGAPQEVKPPPPLPQTTETGSTAQDKDTTSNMSTMAKQFVGFETLSKVKDMLRRRLSQSSSSSGLVSEEKVPSVENNEADNRQTSSQESNFDLSSEEFSSDFSEEEELDDNIGTLDIVTVEEGKQEEVIAKMKEDALRNSHNIRIFTDEPYRLEKYKIPYSSRNHKTLEKQRRVQLGKLLGKLREVLNMHSKTSVAHLLSTAAEEVQKEKETSKHLKEEEEKLLQNQRAYVRRLSLESGKSEVLIQNKLKEIFERQKQREKNLKWNPVFSHLLESKAALHQATAPQVSKQRIDQTNLHMLLTMLHPIKSKEPATDPSPVQHPPPSQAAVPPCPTLTIPPSQQGEPPSTESQEAQTKVPSEQAPENVTQNGPQSGSSAPKVLPQQMLASLPLIRSKTGRLILPSSLKPIGHGFYTIMMMEPKQMEEQGEVGSSSYVQPSDGDTNKSLEKNTPPSDNPTDLENKTPSDKPTDLENKTPSDKPTDLENKTPSDKPTDLENKTPFDKPTDLENKTIVEDKAVTSDSDERTPGGLTPLAKLDFNQPVVPLSVDFIDSDLAVIQPPSALRLSFNQLPPLSPEGPDPSPPNIPRRRGRPLKRKGPVAVKTRVSRGGKRQSYKLAVGMGNTTAKVEAGEGDWYPTSAKRGRGRTVKKGLTNPSLKQSTSDGDDINSPIRFSIGSYKNTDSTQFDGDVYTSRPLTRGSLGKDFPSAKKRSWIDMERELEPDPDSDSDSDMDMDLDREYT